MHTTKLKYIMKHNDEYLTCNLDGKVMQYHERDWGQRPGDGKRSRVEGLRLDERLRAETLFSSC